MILSDADRDLLLNDGKPIIGWYVYAWVNEDWCGVYFYIGKGRGDRYKNTKKRGLAFKSITDNWNCFPVILEDGLTEEEAELREVELKQKYIFELGYPIMDGEGHSDSLKHLAVQYAKREKRKNDPDYREGRREMEIKPEFYGCEKRVRNGELTVVDACKELGISRSLWYTWMRKTKKNQCV